jgi:hypothetical protein
VLIVFPKALLIGAFAVLKPTAVRRDCLEFSQEQTEWHETERSGVKGIQSRVDTGKGMKFRAFSEPLRLPTF